MVMAFLSARLRRWLLFAVLLPVVGRLLESLGVRAKNPRVSRALSSAGGYARTPPRAARYLLGRRRR